MTSFLSHLSPIPAFSAYTGPYQVGTRDIEIPVRDLSSPSPSPAPDPSISTVSFRIFYPCEPEKHTKPAYWLPAPQPQHLRAYARFLSAGHKLAAFLSYLPILRTIFYTTIPAARNAKIAKPPEDVKKWPVMIFSHGLGGSRNAYSHITGSVASHGMVVVAAEHRDGSAPISFIHDPDKPAPRAVDYRSLPHTSSPEVETRRNETLKIRLWELGLIHEVLLGLEEGREYKNVAPVKPDNPRGFESLLDVHTPGKVAFAGHSFGASTVIQFLKSVYHSTSPEAEAHNPIYTPRVDSPILKQITTSSPLILLDVWALPLYLKANTWLLKQPLPAYKSPDSSPPLAVLSEAFFKWKDNLNKTRDAISPPEGTQSKVTPNIFYPVASAHLSQSDFGPLFPWLTKKVFKAVDPERTMRLNVRAILESLRRNGIKVADTSDEDMELNLPEVDVSGARQLEEKQSYPLSQDHQILAKDGSVKGWVNIPLHEEKGSGGVTNGHAIEARDPGEAMMEGEVMK